MASLGTNQNARDKSDMVSVVLVLGLLIGLAGSVKQVLVLREATAFLSILLKNKLAQTTGSLYFSTLKGHTSFIKLAINHKDLCDLLLDEMLV